MEISKDEQKVLAAKTAVDTLFENGSIFSGMKIGLGTGSTALPAISRICELINAKKITNIKAVPTSLQTATFCEKNGIHLFSLNSKEIDGVLDLTIDGADEIDGENNLIKGGGAALLLEKIVAYSSKKYAIVADESKSVSSLGSRFPLPVEIIGEAKRSVEKRLEKLGATCTLREGVKKCGPVITDNGNQILDCLWKSGVDARKMEEEIKKIPGVVEVGFFTFLRPTAFIAHKDGSVEKRP